MLGNGEVQGIPYIHLANILQSPIMHPSQWPSPYGMVVQTCIRKLAPQLLSLDQTTRSIDLVLSISKAFRAGAVGKLTFKSTSCNRKSKTSTWIHLGTRISWCKSYASKRGKAKRAANHEGTKFRSEKLSLSRIKTYTEGEESCYVSQLATSLRKMALTVG